MADPPSADPEEESPARLTALREFQREVDERAQPLVVLHGERLQCRQGCTACCVDDLTVFEIEAESIRRSHAGLLRDGEPHPVGACAFLDAEGACRIYSERPYVCRTQGLPLRWFDEAEAGEVVEHRDICPLNDHGVPLEELPDEACWLLGPAEGKLAELAGSSAGHLAESAPRGHVGERVSLRSLFRHS